MPLITTHKECPHANGWWLSIYFWFLRRRYFFCNDCKTAIPNTKWTPKWSAKKWRV